MKKKVKLNQKGFTLIELLAVIVILAILAAIAIPSVISIMHSQNQKALAQNGLNAIHAAKLYVADNNIDQSTSDLTTSNQLKPYVDKAGGVSGDYTVSVTFSSSDGSATYTVTSGDLPNTATSATESQLINYSKTGSGISTPASSSTTGG